MTDKDSLNKISGLLESVATRSVPFLDACSDTKLLAYSDLKKAQAKYRALAKKALSGTEKILDSKAKCTQEYNEVRMALDHKEFSSELITSLTNLRRSYLEEILRPAVKLYLKESKKSKTGIEELYEKVFRLDGLIEVAQFLHRIDSF
ncbi:MAG: hypothetical protein ACFFEF_19415 [Candidatus Thorarchaeota archaeon]